jgi:hypothetical protein
MSNGRKQRAERKVATSVRAQCVARDGYCRLMGLDVCEGPSEWAHLGDKKRFKTRGQAPEVRHTTAGSFIACRRHHRAYDAGVIQIEVRSDLGADGRLLVRDMALVICA